MININEFQVSTFDKKCDLITFSADFLLQRETGTKKIFLYCLNGFFVEVHFNPAEDRLLHIHAFNDNEKLEAYVESVSLDSLLL